MVTAPKPIKKYQNNLKLMEKQPKVYKIIEKQITKGTPTEPQISSINTIKKHNIQFNNPSTHNDQNKLSLDQVLI